MGLGKRCNTENPNCSPAPCQKDFYCIIWVYLVWNNFLGCWPSVKYNKKLGAVDLSNVFFVVFLKGWQCTLF